MKARKPIREYVFDREQDICRCCRIRRAESRHELVPLGRGGKVSKKNCVAVCGKLVGVDPSCHTYLQQNQIGIEMTAEGAEGLLSFRAQTDVSADWMRVEKGLWVASMPGGRKRRDGDVLMGGGIDIKTISVKKFKAGYEVRLEVWTMGNEQPCPMRSAYTPSGDYIGNPKDARYLVVKRGIAPQKRTATSNVCSIGYAKRSRQWFGWSHRAIHGFGVGSVVTKDHCAAESLPVGFKAKTLADAKRIAEAFAESVS